MNLEKIKKELNDLEICDLNSIIRWHIFDGLKILLENRDDIEKIEFINNQDIDDIVYELEENVCEMISNHLDDCINIIDREEDICL